VIAVGGGAGDDRIIRWPAGELFIGDSTTANVSTVGTI
jgi:hypothetical protein